MCGVLLYCKLKHLLSIFPVLKVLASRGCRSNGSISGNAGNATLSKQSQLLASPNITCTSPTLISLYPLMPFNDSR